MNNYPNLQNYFNTKGFTIIRTSVLDTKEPKVAIVLGEYEEITIDEMVVLLNDFGLIKINANTKGEVASLRLLFDGNKIN